MNTDMQLEIDALQTERCFLLYCFFCTIKVQKRSKLSEKEITYGSSIIF